MMDRALTNIIRYLMDDCLPAAIRDNRFFMAPFFMVAYRTLRVGKYMDFKKNYFNWSPQQRIAFYRDLRSISRSRATDLNARCIERIHREIPDCGWAVADFGCGNGFLLADLASRKPSNHYFGLDIVAPRDTNDLFEFKLFDMENETIPAASFDVVLCCHVLEHLAGYERILKSLACAAREKLIVVVPKQRAFRYTLDEHINFFQFPEQLAYQSGLKEVTIENLGGDWILIGKPSS